MRVLGVDPALRVTGYGALDVQGGRMQLVEAGVVTPNVHATLEIRLQVLHEDLCRLLQSLRPDVVVIEEIYSTYRNPKTAILMGHARGVMCLASAQVGVAVTTLGHSHVKRALVGSGSASKTQVGAMVRQLLGLAIVPEPHDVSDALALAIAYVNLHAGRERMRALMAGR